MKHLRRFNEYNNNLYENAINILNNVKDLEYSDSKLPFSESEYKFFNKSIKKFKGNATFNNGKYHEEVPSPYKTFNTVKFIKDNFFNNSNPKLCDLGCGIGSVLEFSKKIGYDVSGVEYKRDFIEIHDELKLNVKYGDFFKMDLTFLQNIDVYLYRPISDTALADKLLDIIYKNTKDDIIIVYLDAPNMYSGTKEYGNYLVFGTQFMVNVLLKNIKSNINELYHIQQSKLLEKIKQSH